MRTNSSPRDESPLSSRPRVAPAHRRAARPLLAASLATLGAWAAFGQQPVFEEQAQKLGLDFVHFNGMTGELYMPEIIGGSVALVDVDGDGDLDIYLGQGALFFEDGPEDLVVGTRYPHPVTDRLYRNELVSASGDGSLRFTDVTKEVGLAAVGNNMGVAAGDFDNDGHVDLYLANLGSNQLLRNTGDGTFEDVTASAGADDPSWSVAASFFDYDRDGWLDLVVGNYVEFRQAILKECTSNTGALDYCGPQSYPPQPNRLLRNRGDGTFENVTVKALVDVVPGTTLGLVTADFDRDGWLDLYVANDLMPNELWLNQGDGTFVNDAMFAGAAVDLQGYAQASMGVVAGDFDGDGAEDLFMSHLSMEMNTLYLNDGSGLFRDASRESGLGLPSWSYTGFGTALADFDNDGLLDLYVGNGAVKRIEAQLREQDVHPLKERNSLFLGTAPGRFEEVPDERRADVVLEEVSRGVAAGDLDNDGDMDLVVANNLGPVRLLRNALEPADESWVGLVVETPAGAGAWRDALGASVELSFEGGRRMVRRVRSDGSYASAVDPRAHFGLGDAGAPAGLEIQWPDGVRERFPAPAAGRYTTVRRGSGKPVPAAPEAADGERDPGVEGR